MSVQRWAHILEEFEADMKTIDSVLKDQTTEEMIYTLLMKYDETKAKEIINRIVIKLNS